MASGEASFWEAEKHIESVPSFAWHLYYYSPFHAGLGSVTWLVCDRPLEDEQLASRLLLHASRSKDELLKGEPWELVDRLQP